MSLSGSLLSPLALCAEGPMSYERTFGPAVDPITQLGWGLGIISLVVIVVITVLLLGALFRSRAPSADPRGLAVSSETGGMSWIYIGVGISSVVLAACMVWTLTTINAVARPLSSPALTVQVTASQWWWAARYESAAPARIFTTANEIHIPVGQPVRFELISGDVIHSFWIPQLAGKMDVIPGQTNRMWLEASRAGVYRGQCAGFCGVQHAHMALVVVADPPETFASWQDDQIESTRPPVTADTIRGHEVFQTHCAACHTIRGTTPAGIRGPNLTHLMSRGTLAAGLLPNTRGNLAGWIANAQSLKPGARMPDQNLSGPELLAVTAYLSTLH
ncbi:MAG: cytochrome c oxidase subunit II [Bryobacteraceae bacterium]